MMRPNKCKLLLLTFVVILLAMMTSANSSQFERLALFDMSSNNGEISIHVDKNNGKWFAKLIPSEAEAIKIPPDIIPFAIFDLAWKEGALLILSHDYKDGRPLVAVYDPDQKRFKTCILPHLNADYRWGLRPETTSLPPFLFVYDTRARRQVSVPTSLKTDGCIELDFKRKQVLRFAGVSQIGAPADIRRIDGQWYVAAGGSVFKWSHPDRWERVFNRPGIKILNLTNSPEGLVALARRNDVSILSTEELATAASPWFRILISTSSRIDAPPALPLGFSDEGHLNLIKKPSDIIASLKASLKAIDGNWLWYFAQSNSEGRLSWGQFYYLQLYLDFLEFPGVFEALKKLDPKFIRALELRLQQEFSGLLQRICNSSLRDYETRRYSLDRQAFHGVVNIGRLAELLGRYEVVSNKKLPAGCWTPLTKMLLTLEGTWDEIIKANNAMPAVNPRRYFFRRRRNVAFARDGNNLPFNHVNAWISGIIWAEKAGRITISPMLEQVIRDQWFIFSRFAGYPKSRQDPFKWLYTWGPSFSGWKADSGISMNSPAFKGSRYHAGKGYLMMDYQAMLESRRRFPSMFSTVPSDPGTGIMTYAKKGTIGSFLFRHMAIFHRRGIEVPVSRKLLMRSMKPAGLFELRSALWASALWLNHYGNEGELTAVFPAGQSPVLNTKILRIIAKPGELIPLETLFGEDFESIKSDRGLSVDIFDAHCGRGFFQASGDILADRMQRSFKLVESSSIYYNAAGQHNEYDEIRIRIRNGFGDSGWKIIKVISKGKPIEDTTNRKKRHWTVRHGECFRRR